MHAPLGFFGRVESVGDHADLFAGHLQEVSDGGRRGDGEFLADLGAFGHVGVAVEVEYEGRAVDRGGVENFGEEFAGARGGFPVDAIERIALHVFAYAVEE